MLMMVGTASFRISFSTGSVVIFMNFASVAPPVGGLILFFKAILYLSFMR